MPKRKSIVCATPSCSERFVPKRATSKYHSPTCRAKAARLAGADPVTGEVIAEFSNGAPKTVLVKNVKVVDAPEYDRAKHLAAFQKMGLSETNWLPTGILDFDALTRIPRGRITQIQGRYGVGKTTLCLNMIAGQKGVKTLYIDAEAALNPILLADLGIDSGQFTLYNESNYIEDIFDVVKKAAKEGKYDLIVLDSVPMTTSKSIEDSDPTARNIGQKAFIYHKLCETIAMDLKHTDTAMVFVNQVRDVIGGYIPQTYTPGGTGIPFQASLIVELKTIPSWRFPDKPKDKIYLGHEVEAKIIKSKVNQPHRVKKFKLFYPEPYAEVEIKKEDTEDEEF